MFPSLVCRHPEVCSPQEVPKYLKAKCDMNAPGTEKTGRKTQGESGFGGCGGECVCVCWVPFYLL